MGAQILDSNSSANLTPAVSEAGIALPGYLVVILSVLMVTLVIVVVAGNALVIMAFMVDKTLRNQSNYFFLNLAISDFLVGRLVLSDSYLYFSYVTSLISPPECVLRAIQYIFQKRSYCFWRVFI